MSRNPNHKPISSAWPLRAFHWSNGLILSPAGIYRVSKFNYHVFSCSGLMVRVPVLESLSAVKQHR